MRAANVEFSVDGARWLGHKLRATVLASMIGCSGFGPSGADEEEAPIV